MRSWRCAAMLLMLLSQNACSNRSGILSCPLDCLQGTRTSEGVFDLSAGEFNEGEAIHPIYVVKNVSAATVSLREEVQTSCSCMGATLEKATLEPGESTKIQVHLSATGASGSEQIVQAVAHVLQPEASKPLVVRLHYRVKPAWLCQPSRLVLKTDQDGWASGEVQVISRGEPQLQVVSAKSSLPQSECVVKNEPNDGHNPTFLVASIQVRGRVPLGSGVKEYALTVHANNKNIPSRQVQVIADAPAPVRVEPSILHLTPEAAAVATGRIIGAGRSVRLLDATTADRGIEAVIESLEPSGSGDIGRLVIRPRSVEKLQPGIALVKLRYRVGDGEQPLELTVPVAIGQRR